MKNKIIFVISLITLLVLSTVFSYAYFHRTMTGNDEAQGQVVETGTLSLHFEDGPEVTLDNAYPGDKIEKVFTVENTGTLETEYTLYMIELINTFINDELLYFYTCTSYKDGVEYETCDSLENQITPYSTSPSQHVIKTNIPIEPGVTHAYKLTILFEEKNTLQNYNQGQSFSGKIQLLNYTTVIKEIAKGSNYIFEIETNEDESATCSTYNESVATCDIVDSELIIYGVEIGNTQIMLRKGNVTEKSYQINVVESLVTNIAYSGTHYTYTTPKEGQYLIELWGAGGISVRCDSNTWPPSNGAYTSGRINLAENEQLVFYVGGKGENQCSSGTGGGGYNGGGNGTYGTYGIYASASGGAGATDVRFFEGDLPSSLTWSNIEGLTARIMVAGGGASGTDPGRAAITLSGGGGISSDASVPGSTINSSWSTYYVTGATQTSGGYSTFSTNLKGTFGTGSNGENNAYGYGSRGGGGGYWGGGGSLSENWSGSGNRYRPGGPTGGSSFISGHTGCVAVSSQSVTTPRTGTNDASCSGGTNDNLCSIHYTGKKFENTIMIDGSGHSWSNVKEELTLMPNPTGGYYEEGEGHPGNGYAKITYIGK